MQGGLFFIVFRKRNVFFRVLSCIEVELGFSKKTSPAFYEFINTTAFDGKIEMGAHIESTLFNCSFLGCSNMCKNLSNHFLIF